MNGVTSQVATSIATCAIFASATLVAPVQAQANANRPELSFVTVDSHEIDYPAHNKVKNHQVLELVLPRMLERTFRVRTRYVDVLRPVRYVWPDADTIAASRPDIIVLHWSAFRTSAGQCNPDPAYSTPTQRNCAIRLAGLIADVSRYLDHKVAFIIYSRQPTLCERGFKNALYRILMNNADARQAKIERRIGLLAITLTARQASLKSAQTQADMKAMILAFRDQKPLFKANNRQGICLLSTPS